MIYFYLIAFIPKNQMNTINHHSQNFFTTSSNTTNNLPINHRAPWTDKETKQLIKEIKNNFSIENIANIHKRTINAIKYKLIRYAIDMADTDQTLSLNDISNKTGLSVMELKEGFDKLHYDYEYMEDNDSIQDTDEESDDDTDDTFIINDSQVNNDIENIRNDIDNRFISLNKKLNYITLGFIGYCIINLSFTIYSKFNVSNDMSLMLLPKK